MGRPASGSNLGRRVSVGGGVRVGLEVEVGVGVGVLGVPLRELGVGVTPPRGVGVVPRVGGGVGVAPRVGGGVGVVPRVGVGVGVVSRVGGGVKVLRGVDVGGCRTTTAAESTIPGCQPAAANVWRPSKSANVTPLSMSRKSRRASRFSAGSRVTAFTARTTTPMIAVTAVAIAPHRMT